MPPSHLDILLIILEPQSDYACTVDFGDAFSWTRRSGLLLRVQDVIDNWDPRKLVNPYVETSSVTTPDGQRRVSKQLKRPDLAEFIADVEAAEALGKALFWEMQAGSDFRRTANGTYVGTACASCHYRNGADARNRNTVRIPYVAWDKYNQDPKHPLEFGEKNSTVRH